MKQRYLRAAAAPAVVAAAMLCFGCHRRHCLLRRGGACPPAEPPPAVVAPDTSALPPTYAPPSGNHQAGYYLAPSQARSYGYSTDMRYPQRQQPTSGQGVRPAAPSVPSVSRRPAARLGTKVEPLRSGRHPAAAATPSRPAHQPRPADLPRYCVVESNVATGGQPTLDGLRWLRDRRFRTILNLRPKDEADPAEAGLVRQMGMRYLALPVTPQTLTDQLVQQFNQIADDGGNRPLFIHDRTGSTAGALWYLHLLYVDRVPEESARRVAEIIGLKTSDTDLWLAIQKYRAAHPLPGTKPASSSQQ